MSETQNSYCRSVIGIRSYRIGFAEIRLKNLLLNFFKPEDIYFVIDGRSYAAPIQNDVENIIVLNLDDLTINGCEDWGWRCGDFFYYAFYNSIDSDFYYLIEPDVWFTQNTGVMLFNSLNKTNVDFVAYNISKVDGNWYWKQSMLNYTQSVFKCAFPFTRLSKLALKYLYEQRLILDHITTISTHPYPNDESFVASKVCGSGDFDFLSLENLSLLKWKFFSTMNTRPIEFCNVDGYLYHSALDFDDFVIKLKKIALKNMDPSKIFRLFDFSFGETVIDQVLLDRFKGSLEGPIAENFYTWIETNKLR